MLTSNNQFKRWLRSEQETRSIWVNQDLSGKTSQHHAVLFYLPFKAATFQLHTLKKVPKGGFCSEEILKEPLHFLRITF